MNKIVINKNNGKQYEVLDVTYDKAGYPHFLVYKENEDSKNGQWIRMSAKHFRPYTKEDYYKELADAKFDFENGRAETTISFANYDC